MEQEGGALIQTADGQWLEFVRPEQVIVADRPEDVAAAIALAERLAVERGWHAVGFVAYEAGAAWGLPVRPSDPTLPLVWFGLYASRQVSAWDGASGSGHYQVSDLGPSVGRSEFGAAFDRVRRHLAGGDTYQANYTFRMTGRFAGSARRLFVDLADAQQGRFAAFIDLGRLAICSASPELFFAREGRVITARPMKGTTRRGRTTAEDARQRAALVESPKQRAENVMIVDMMRNDLGRIAEVASVSVPSLFDAERYPNVWQMTSSVTARTGVGLAGIFGALHPSASVTGAPKIRTMDILRELEPHPRGVYTGAIGHVRPDGAARFSVAIRTAVVNRPAGRVQFGIGSGLVWDSDANDEYEECLLKGSILGRAIPEFDLLETLRWTPDEGFWLLERHLERLRDSAAYFDRPVAIDAVHGALESSVAGASEALRVRLLVGRRGEVRVERQPVATSNEPVVLRLATAPVDTSNVFLFHKTTRRQMYDAARLPDCDDTLLWNADGLVTEATMANVLVDTEEGVVTPPIDCGLLAGTCRADLLARGEVREGRVSLSDLQRARRLWVANAVHGRRLATLVPA